MLKLYSHLRQNKMKNLKYLLVEHKVQLLILEVLKILVGIVYFNLMVMKKHMVNWHLILRIKFHKDLKH